MSKKRPLPARFLVGATVALVGLSIIAGVASGQVRYTGGGEEESIRRPQYYLAPGLEEELKIKVRVWGELNVPGLYIVRDGTDLVEVLSLAGGPTEDAKLSDVRIVRAAGDFTRVIEVDVEDFVRSGADAARLTLQPDDTIMVPAKFWPRAFRWTGLIGTLALVANVIVNASN
jgi:hypothetical protein